MIYHFSHLVSNLPRIVSLDKLGKLTEHLSQVLLKELCHVAYWTVASGNDSGDACITIQHFFLDK